MHIITQKAIKPIPTATATPTATDRDHPPVTSPTMHSSLVCQNRNVSLGELGHIKKKIWRNFFNKYPNLQKKKNLCNMLSKEKSLVHTVPGPRGGQTRGHRNVKTKQINAFLKVLQV